MARSNIAAGSGISEGRVLRCDRLRNIEFIRQGGSESSVTAWWPAYYVNIVSRERLQKAPQRGGSAHE